MSGGRPSRAAARRASERWSALLDGEEDDSDASEPEDEPEASEGGMSDDELEPAPASAASRRPPKRARSGKGRPEARRKSRVRAEQSPFSPAQKMEKMRLWFEQNGIPPRRDTSAGFDMRTFWDNCCSRVTAARRFDPP